MAISQHKRNIHVTFSDDLLSAADENARAANRTRSQELEYGYLEYVTKAGRARQGELEGAAAVNTAETPPPGLSAAGEAHLKEHRRLGLKQLQNEGTTDDGK